jgi:hypothetical protein
VWAPLFVSTMPLWPGLVVEARQGRNGEPKPDN